MYRQSCKVVGTNISFTWGRR